MAVKKNYVEAKVSTEPYKNAIMSTKPTRKTLSEITKNLIIIECISSTCFSNREDD